MTAGRYLVTSRVRMSHPNRSVASGCKTHSDGPARPTAKDPSAPVPSAGATVTRQIVGNLQHFKFLKECVTDHLHTEGGVAITPIRISIATKMVRTKNKSA